MRKTLFAVVALTMAVSALALTADTDLYVQSVAHGLGRSVDGVRAHWQADIWIFNPSTSQSASVTVFLLLRGQANPAPDSRGLSVAPGETRYLPDVVLGTFGSNDTYGALHITSDIPVVVTGVSYDANVTVVNKGLGSAGQFFSATPADMAIGAGASTDLIGLDQDGIETAGTWRSNIALVETTGSPADFIIDRIDSLGTVVASLPYHLEGAEANQINLALTAIGGGTGTNQRIRVRGTGGSGRAVVVGSRVNNATGDPSTIEMTGSHVSGQFQGVLWGDSGTSADGGIKFVISNSGLAAFEGVAEISCETDEFTVPFSSDATAGPSALNLDGTFSTIVSIPYTSGTSIAFTTDWTLSGARGIDGTWSGTLVSTTHGGNGPFAGCNVVGVVRQWKAGWTGSS